MIQRVWWPFVGFVMLVLFFAVRMGYQQSPIAESSTSQPLTFQAQELYSKKNVDEKIFANHVNVVHVWASWCRSCQHDHRLLLKLANHSDVQWVGVNYRDIPENASHWLSSLGNPYQHNLIDVYGEMTMAMGVYGTPETFIVDQQGKIVKRHRGSLTEDIWRRDFLPVIEEIKNA